MLNLCCLALQITKIAPRCHSNFIKMDHFTRTFILNASGKGKFLQFASVDNKNKNFGWNFLQIPSNNGVRNKSVYTKGERHLIELLTQKLILERQAQELKEIPAEFEGYNVFTHGSILKFIKGSEQYNSGVAITVDVNEPPNFEPQNPVESIAKPRCKPKFTVYILKSTMTCCFNCSFNKKPKKGKSLSESFTINEISVYYGEWRRTVYQADCKLMEGDLYYAYKDLLVENFIDNDFIEKLWYLVTGYEQILFIKLLENMNRFASGDLPKFDEHKKQPIK